MDEFTVVATNEQLVQIHALAVEQMRLEVEIETKTQELDELKKSLRKIEQGSLPDAIQQAGLSEVKTSAGDMITVKEDITVSVPKARLHDIVQWLNDNKHGDIVTGKVYVEIPKNGDNEKKAAIQALIDAGLEPAEETNVNTATLKSILRDHLKKGENIDLAHFGGFAWRKAIIKRP